MTNFEKTYADTLNSIIRTCKFHRHLNHSVMNDLCDFIDADTFGTIYTHASSFPNAEDLSNHTYQTTSYIGYLRGFEDCLDMLSHLLRDSFREEQNDEQ